jgi:magnesium-protoporphyrin O-methyltransferase
MSCCQPASIEKQFDSGLARKDLKRYRRRGPDAPTRALIAAVEAHTLPARATLIDVGGGVGAIHHALLESGFAEATQVDASEAFIAMSKEEVGRIGHGARVRFEHGDFAALAPTLPNVDVVTLDRVVCCSPDYDGLLRAAAEHARHLVAFSYPRPRSLVRFVVKFTNWRRRTFSDGFEVHVHSPAAMAAVLERAGLRHAWAGGTWVWAVEVFERADTVPLQRR